VKSILAAASKSYEIRVVADQWGCPTAADGLGSAIMLMIPALLSEPRPAEIYHYCDAGVVNRADFAAEIIRQAELSCRVIPVSSSEYPMAAARPVYSALDTAKITHDFGIVPSPWQDALRTCLHELGIKIKN
jgi:dTDP-4-dehydrorhamnose reductase